MSVPFEPAKSDVRALVKNALAASPAERAIGAGTTSDLSIDEELNLHAVGWESVELVTGYSMFSTPVGLWSWGQGEIVAAARAHANAFRMATSRISDEAAAAGAHGVVGVHVERAVHLSFTEVSLIGTAVRPIGAARVPAARVFASDLSARDFARLAASGWEPLGLAVGASFVYAPRRTMGAVLQQQSQNVELANYTEAIYSARELAMERMQRAAIDLKGTGVVEVKIVEGPMAFASHAVGFAAWGTVVRLAGSTHQNVEPTMVVSLDDAVLAFDAATLE